MKALISHAPGVIRDANLDDPVAGIDEALVRIEAAGISGADITTLMGQRPQADPLVLGHEAAGIIEGGEMHGQRVALNPVITCQMCPACTSGRTNLCPARQDLGTPARPGVMAELVVVPRRTLVPVPDSVTATQACLIAPLARGWHGARLSRRAYPRGRNALVIGGGAVGVSAALALTAQGLDEVTLTGVAPPRADYLRAGCGQNVVADGDLPDGPTFDIVIDALGSAASCALASRIVMPGGVLGHVGLGEGANGLDLRRITLDEITLVGTSAFTAQDFYDTASAAFEGRLGPLDWVETRPLSDGAKAFADVQAGGVAAPRVILLP